MFFLDLNIFFVDYVLMKNNTIDEIDETILEILQKNARTSNAEIARTVGMAPSGVAERIKKLEQKGIIKGYEALIDAKAVGKNLTAFTFVRTEETVGSTESGRLLGEIPEVLEVHHTAGEDCYLLKVKVEDTGALGELLKKFGGIETVKDTRTTIVLTTVKEIVAPEIKKIKSTEE